MNVFSLPVLKADHRISYDASRFQCGDLWIPKSTAPAPLVIFFHQIPPALPPRWMELARRMGDTSTVKMIPSAGHDDGVDPESHAWGAVREAVHKMLFS